MKKTLSMLAATVALTLPSLALADALPPDACTSIDEAGEPCSNAGPGSDQAGVCVAKKCSSARPDGGSEEYDCAICEVASNTSSSGGSTNTSSSGGTNSSGGNSSGGNSSGGSSGTTETEDEGGCSTSGTTRDGLASAGMIGLGLVAWAWSRRRRS